MSEDFTLSFSHENMKKIGYRTVDMIIDHFENLTNKPATRKANRNDLKKLLDEPMPVKGNDPLQVLDRVEQDIFRNTMFVNHPRFFGFIPSPSNFISVMADALAAGFNVFAGTWMEAAAPAQIELIVIEWLIQMFGLSNSAGGLFTSGGSMANLIALTAARHKKLDDNMENIVVYCSDQTHSSIDRACRILGFKSKQLTKLKSDSNFRLDLNILRTMVENDRKKGFRPFCVVANAGTTNTGAIDPLVHLADFCREEDLWFHVDGAYGASAVFCETGRKLLVGLEKADSITLDPHKWLFQPYEIGCVLVRKKEWLQDTFYILPEYLKDAEGGAEEVNFCDYGPQLTRSFRALKLWMTFQVFGSATISQAVQKGFDLAELAEHVLNEFREWTVITPTQMGIVSFRFEPQGYTAEQIDNLNQSIVKAMIDDGFAMISSTKLRGRTVLRMCPINPRTTEQDIRSTISRLDNLGHKMT